MNCFGELCGTHSTFDQLKINMLLYCLKTMRKRTVDEQLRDFAEIMETSMQLTIVYEKSELEVIYDVGSDFGASVKGFDEYSCVRQCKQDILHKLRTFCNYSVGSSRNPSRFVRETDTSDLMNNTRDIYSEIALSKQNLTPRENNKMVLIDPDMNSELNEYVDIDDLPLILQIHYFQNQMETSYEFGSCYASASGTTESTCMQQCKKRLLQELRTWASNARESTNDLMRYNEQLIKYSRTAEINVVNEPQKFIDEVSEIMNNLEQHNFSKSTDLFLDILVAANNTSSHSLKHITDLIVSKAIYEPEYSPMYAKLCSDANKRALETSGENRLGFPEAFKYNLIDSCKSILWQAGAFHLYESTNKQCPCTHNVSSSEEIDVEARICTLGTCRFMGELFMQNDFKMITIIMKTVRTFIRAHDAHSLECLCVLLTIIGSKFEKINTAFTSTEFQEYSTARVYELLKSYGDSGSTDGGCTLLPWRTTSMINQLLSIWSSYWMNEKSQMQRNVFPIHMRPKENPYLTEVLHRDTVCVETEQLLASLGIKFSYDMAVEKLANNSRPCRRYYRY